MDAVSAELQAVLREVSRAQQLEDEQHSTAATDSYYRATCQLSYLLDMHLDRTKDAALAELLCGLQQQYNHRIAVLKSRTATDSEWMQLDPSSAAQLQLDNSSLASTTYAGYDNTACDLQEQQLQAAMVAAGAAGLQSCFTNGGAAAEASQGQGQSAVELLRLCQRAVSGSLEDVVGLEDVKEEIEEAVFLPLQHPYLFKGIRQPARTFLLYGPPGTGKTMLVEKVAAEAEFSMLSISPSMILSKWAGDSEKAISQVFELARTMQPSILFLDEVDSLGPSREGNTDGGARRLLTELLIQFNRVAEDEGVYIFAATNRMQDCDPALLRRFSRRIQVPLPNQQERQCFFQAILSRPEVTANLTQSDLELLAERTSHYSGSDLAAVCRLAAMAPVKELFQQQRQQRRQQQKGVKRCRFECRVQETLDNQGSSRASVEQQPGGNCAVQAAAAGAAVTPAAAGGGLTQHSADACRERLQLRKLVLADFQAAIAKVLPATVDAQVLPASLNL